MDSTFILIIIAVFFTGMFLYYSKRFLGIFIDANTSCGGCTFTIITIICIIWGIVKCSS